LVVFVKTFERTGVQASVFGLGRHHLGPANTDQVANEMAARAFHHGIDFFDSAWEYSDGL
jgi:aryl-alcohol dehydrogenase-like predicted oxidoreductase